MVPHFKLMLRNSGLFDEIFREEAIADLWAEYFPAGRQMEEADAEGAARLARSFLEACIERKAATEMQLATCCVLSMEGVGNGVCRV